jgi:hypothetical protein
MLDMEINSLPVAAKSTVTYPAPDSLRATAKAGTSYHMREIRLGGTAVNRRGTRCGKAGPAHSAS